MLLIDITVYGYTLQPSFNSNTNCKAHDSYSFINSDNRGAWRRQLHSDYVLISEVT